MRRRHDNSSCHLYRTGESHVAGLHQNNCSIFQRIKKTDVMQVMEGFGWEILPLCEAKCELARSLDVSVLLWSLKVLCPCLNERYKCVINNNRPSFALFDRDRSSVEDVGFSTPRLHNSIQRWATSNDDGRHCRGESRHCSRWHSHQWFGATFASPSLSITKSWVTWRPNITRFTQQPSS